MSFSTLPTELVEMVLFQIEERKSILSFLQTCKRFNHIAHTEITMQQYERFTSSSALESAHPWRFLLASCKASHIADWAISAPEPARAARAEELRVAITGGVESLGNFTVSTLGLTYLDAILERTFYRQLYIPLRNRTERFVDVTEESHPHPELLEMALLDMAIFIGICHPQFTRNFLIAVRDDNIKSASRRRKSLGKPQNMEFAKEFLINCAWTISEPSCSHCGSYIQRKLVKLLTRNLKSWRWPMWRIDENGADIMPHVYGFAGLLAQFEGRHSSVMIDALSSV